MSLLGFDAVGRFALGQLGNGAVVSVAVNEDSWHQPFSTDVVRRRAPMPTGAHQFASFVQFAPFAETVSADRWFVPFSEPVRFSRRLATALQQFAAFTQFQIRLDTWFVPFNEPTRFRPRLATAEQQFASFVQFAPFNEVVWADRWFVPFSEPVRLRPRLVTAAQWFGRGIEFPLTTSIASISATLFGVASVGGVPTSNYKQILTDNTRRLVYAAELSPWTVSQ
jgi:hypothetical protein